MKLKTVLAAGFGLAMMSGAASAAVANFDLGGSTDLNEWSFGYNEGGVSLTVSGFVCSDYSSGPNSGSCSAERIDRYSSGIGMDQSNDSDHELDGENSNEFLKLAFNPVVKIESLTFTDPSANTLMFFLDRTSVLEFDVGLVPGVVLGSFLSALLAKELKFQGFEGSTPMRNAMIGAVMMGFGGMLAGGCAIGAGVSGGSIFAGTAWLALFCMWIGGMSMDLVMGGRGQPAAI